MVVEDVAKVQEELAPTNELVAGIMGNMCRNNSDFFAKLNKTPKETLNSLTSDIDVDMSDINIHLAHNTENTVHVPLPCYQTVCTALSDEQLLDIAGGEVIGIILATIGATVTLGFVASTVACVAIGVAVVAGIATAIAGAVAGGAYLIAEGAGAI